MVSAAAETKELAVHQGYRWRQRHHHHSDLHPVQVEEQKWLAKVLGRLSLLPDSCLGVLDQTGRRGLLASHLAENA